MTSVVVLARAVRGSPFVGVGRRVSTRELALARRNPNAVATLLLVRWYVDEGARAEAAVERLVEDLRRARLVTLTPAMACYLEASAAGLTLPRIAHHFGVGEDTVKTVLARARRRLEARNTTHAVATAIRLGLIR